MKRKIFIISCICLFCILLIFLIVCGDKDIEECKEIVLDNLKKIESQYGGNFIITEENNSSEEIGIKRGTKYYTFLVKHEKLPIVFNAYVDKKGNYLGNNYYEYIYHNNVMSLVNLIVYKYSVSDITIHKYDFKHFIDSSNYIGWTEYIKESDGYLEMFLSINSRTLDEILANINSLLQELSINHFKFKLKLDIFINDNFVGEISISSFDKLDYNDSNVIIKKLEALNIKKRDLL